MLKCPLHWLRMLHSLLNVHRKCLCWTISSRNLSLIKRLKNSLVVASSPRFLDGPWLTENSSTFIPLNVFEHQSEFGRASSDSTGNFLQFPNREQNGEFLGFDRYLIGISQTGKMLPKPILGLKNPLHPQTWDKLDPV